MTAMDTSLTGALIAKTPWDSISWKPLEAQVHRLQMRIAKATRESRHDKVKALQWLLTHSFYAKLLAVKRVVQNKGGKTPGVDKVIWNTPQKKMKAALSLRRRGYKTLPLRRIDIPKANGGLRPLCIPSMKCRAMQALHLLALEPIAETKADKNSYGFRPKRATADAIEQCFNALCKKGSAPWILEADIKSCFNKISHSWLKSNIPMDKTILDKWLTAGYIHHNVFHPMQEGTPQGSIISPTLLNMTLSGLEARLTTLLPRHKAKVHVSVYADDFIITGATREVLTEKIKPALEEFLQERGLELSVEKTKITSIDEVFDFLGFNIRKYKGKLLTKPSKKNVQNFLKKVRQVIKSNPTAKTENLIYQLNPLIRGWAMYMRHVCAKKTYYFVDHHIFECLGKWIRRRHPGKSAKWRKSKYFRCQGSKNWIFSCKTIGKMGTIDLFKASSISIKRHIKIRAEATPYDPQFAQYFKWRESHKTRSANGEIKVPSRELKSMTIERVAGSS